MSEIIGIRPASVTAWLSDLGIEFSRPLAFERIGLGQSNLTYLLSDATGRKWVLRRPPVGELLSSAHDVHREARVLSALMESEVPVPRIYGETKDPSTTDVSLVLMEYVDGTVVDRMSIAETLTPRRREEIGLSMARTLATVHGVNLDQVGLSAFASRSPYALRQLKRWSGQWELSRNHDLPDVDDLTQRLGAAIPEQREVTLVHGDFHLRNVITSSESGDVIAVLDWELSTLGDPSADLGSMLAYWVESGEESGVEFPATALPGFPTRAELVDAYVQASGRDPEHLPYWRAFGLWKLAIIAQGVFDRASDDRDNNPPSGTPTQEHVEAFVRRALDAAEQARI